MHALMAIGRTTLSHALERAHAAGVETQVQLVDAGADVERRSQDRAEADAESHASAPHRGGVHPLRPGG